MKTLLWLPLSLLLLSLPATGWAQPSVVVVPFTGPGASASRTQVALELCRQRTCVGPAKLTRKGKPDWKKIARAEVWVVTGKVSGKASSRLLRVELFDSNAEPKGQFEYPVAKNGKLARPQLDELLSGLQQALAPPAPPPPPAATPDLPPPPATVAQPEPASPPPPPPPTPAEETARREPVEPAPVAPVVTEPAPAEPEPRAQGARRPLVVAEAGAAFLNRTFDYSDLSTPNLRPYETRPGLVAPRVRAEVYPLARATTGAAQGVGLEADYLFSVGLRSVDENDVAYPTSMSRLDVGLRFNLWPLADPELMVAPVVGYRMAGFVTNPSEGNNNLSGLPDLSYGAVHGGVDASLAFGPVVPFARLEYVHVLSLGEIGENDFFPDSSANGLEAQLGAGYEVIPNLELRLAFLFTRYGLSFQPAENARYRASGAVDRYLGGALTARYAY